MPSIELEPMPAPTLQRPYSHPHHPLQQSISKTSQFETNVRPLASSPQPYLEAEGDLGLHVTETASRADYTFPEVFTSLCLIMSHKLNTNREEEISPRRPLGERIELICLNREEREHGP